MKNASEVRLIVSCSRKGWTDTKIAEKFHFSRNTVRKYRRQYNEAIEKLSEDRKSVSFNEILEYMLNHQGYDSTNRKPYRYTKEMDELLDKLIEEDLKKGEGSGKRAKLRSKKDMYEVIKAHGFDIGYSTICQKIDEKRFIKFQLHPWVDLGMGFRP